MTSLQDSIERHGGALELLRSNSVEVSGIFPYPLEHSNWRDEQRAWATTAVLLNQSYHRSDLVISGPDSVRLLAETSVNGWGVSCKWFGWPAGIVGAYRGSSCCRMRSGR